MTALSVDCETPADERARALEDFREGRLKILVNVELFTEGFDCPSIEFVILARPTRSLALYLQQVGRALRPSPGGEDVLILDAGGPARPFRAAGPEKGLGGALQGREEQVGELQPTAGTRGSPGAAGKLLVEVSRERFTGSANVEATPHEWSIYHITDKLNIIDGHGNAILKEHLLQDLQRDEDGNWSAWLGIRESGCMEGRWIRFTPGLALVPDNTFEVNGCRVHAFQPRRTRRSPVVTGHDGREYTLSLDLETRRYVKIYAWNTERVVMRSEDNTYRYTDRNLYPEVKECKVSLINDEPYLFTPEFIVGKNSASHFYRRLPHGLYLYYRREGKEDVLYNAQLEPLWRGKKIEVLNEGMVLHDTDGKSRKVLYMDMLFGDAGV